MTSGADAESNSCVRKQNLPNITDRPLLLGWVAAKVDLPNLSSASAHRIFNAWAKRYQDQAKVLRFLVSFINGFDSQPHCVESHLRLHPEERQDLRQDVFVMAFLAETRIAL